MYLQDYDERFPSERDTVDGVVWYNTGNWVTTRFGNYQPKIYPYVKNKQVFLCPSSQRSNPAQQFAYDYAMNTSLYHRKLAEIDRPASLLVIGDTRYEWIDRAQRIAARHNGGANLAFCDGHAKWLKGQTIAGRPEMKWPGYSKSSWLRSGPPTEY